MIDSIGFLPGRDRGREPRSASCAGSASSPGYAGWGPGQLEDELADGAWIVVAARPSDVFTSAPDSLWSDVLRREGGALAIVALLPTTRASTRRAAGAQRHRVNGDNFAKQPPSRPPRA